ncbi:uncharacterized protein LOC123006942 isoform X2 [Tribolium madens]|uniref:uncharacterized protein LOC123006942 isoform X2 n=1 Tax=Tribolium madens TaxID=41895 RepID=UPI001CF74DEE|nr:uncharacterized protein LOC123006942 isoform X2 [Tribolium madens]
MKPSMVYSNGISLLMLLAAGMILFQATTTYAAPHSSSYPGYYSPLSMEGQNPEYLLQTIARLRQALISDDDLENSKEDTSISKRFLSFGVDRGSSGKVENLTRCLAFRASSPCGPGRRKRNLNSNNCYEKRRVFTCLE